MRRAASRVARGWWGAVALLAGCATSPCRCPSEPRCDVALPSAPAPFDPVPLVDPFVGTGGHGHTFPGASLPFGMVQLSPDTRLEGWDSCGGYHHDDELVYGFSHTHLSGTGVPDYADVLLVPTVGAVTYHNGADGKPGYRSKFRHATERAEAGSYSVFLDDPGVKVELTATRRVGLHRYTFPVVAEANVVLDLTHRDEVIESSVEVVGDRELRGLRRSRGWASNQPVWFVARFSRPFASFALAVDDAEVAGTSAKGANVKAHVRFDARDARPVEVRVGISGVDVEGAARNLDEEVGAATSTRSGRAPARRGVGNSGRSRSPGAATRSGAPSTPRSTTRASSPTCSATWTDATSGATGRSTVPTDTSSTRSSRSGTPSAPSIRCSPSSSRAGRPTSSARCSRSTRRAARCPSGSCGATRRAA